MSKKIIKLRDYRFQKKISRNCDKVEMGGPGSGRHAGSGKSAVDKKAEKMQKEFKKTGKLPGHLKKVVDANKQKENENFSKREKETWNNRK